MGCLIAPGETGHGKSVSPNRAPSLGCPRFHMDWQAVLASGSFIPSAASTQLRPVPRIGPTSIFTPPLMETLKTFVLVAVVAAAAALFLAVFALFEIYKPAHTADLTSLGMDSRLTRLEKQIADQEAILSRIESTQAGTPSFEQKTEADLKRLREGVQVALNQVGVEIGNLNEKIAKLDERARQTPGAQTESKAQPPAGNTVESPYLAHRAAPEDTLASIATKYSVKEEDIISINPPWIDFSHLRSGQTIYVPRE